ncbi:hypothetical protein AAVH_32474, partial [Aphelenchoides avenae]
CPSSNQGRLSPLAKRSSQPTATALSASSAPMSPRIIGRSSISRTATSASRWTAAFMNCPPVATRRASLPPTTAFRLTPTGAMWPLQAAIGRSNQLVKPLVVHWTAASRIFPAQATIRMRRRMWPTFRHLAMPARNRLPTASRRRALRIIRTSK